MKALTLALLLSLYGTTAFALPSNDPTPILGEAHDSGQQQAQQLH